MIWINSIFRESCTAKQIILTQTIQHKGLTVNMGTNSKCHFHNFYNKQYDTILNLESFYFKLTRDVSV